MDKLESIWGFGGSNKDEKLWQLKWTGLFVFFYKSAALGGASLATLGWSVTHALILL
jgi:hypothetical protein